MQEGKGGTMDPFLKFTTIFGVELFLCLPKGPENYF